MVSPHPWGALPGFLPRCILLTHGGGHETENGYLSAEQCVPHCASHLITAPSCSEMISSILQVTELSLAGLGRAHAASYRLSQGSELVPSFRHTCDFVLPQSSSLGHVSSALSDPGSSPRIIISLFPLWISVKIFTCVCHRMMPFEHSFC